MREKTVNWYCPECESLWNNLGYMLDACPKCSNTKLEPVDTNVPPMVDERTVDRFVIDTISQADGYIISEQECWMCHHGGHYMIWPGKRDEAEYTKVTPLLRLPQCPVKVWEHADKTAFNITLEDFLRSVEVQKGKE